eukprot:442815-Pyramimonas_sp.AAC.1
MRTADKIRVFGELRIRMARAMHKKKVRARKTCESLESVKQSFLADVRYGWGRDRRCAAAACPTAVDSDACMGPPPVRPARPEH